MRKLPFRIFVLGLLASLFPALATRAADAPPKINHRFKTSIVSRMDLNQGGKTEKIDGKTDITYTWRVRGAYRYAVCDSMQVKVNHDGKETMNSAIIRDKFTTVENGLTKVIPYGRAPDSVKKMLIDSFGEPLVRLQVDENGKELKRTVVAGPGAKDLVENGLIANMLMFHVPFLPDQDEWQAPAQVSMGSNAYATGPLTFTKSPAADGVQAVKVSGTLTRDNATVMSGVPNFKDVRYVVSGVQTYDPKEQDWKSGELTIDTSFRIVEANKSPSTSTGKMTIKLERLPEKASAAPKPATTKPPAAAKPATAAVR